jgi:hypothetical protein
MANLRMLEWCPLAKAGQKNSKLVSSQWARLDSTRLDRENEPSRA